MKDSQILEQCGKTSNSHIRFKIWTLVKTLSQDAAKNVWEGSPVFFNTDILAGVQNRHYDTEINT